MQGWGAAGAPPLHRAYHHISDRSKEDQRRIMNSPAPTPDRSAPSRGARSGLRLLGLLVVLLGLGLGAPHAPVALADRHDASEPVPPGAESEAQRVGFGIVPATADDVDRRAFLSFGLTPGSVAYDHVAVVNYSPEDLALDVYATDAVTADGGGFSLLAAAETPVDLGAWTTVGDGTRTITVPGRSDDGRPGRVILPVTITIPANASPGDHAAGVVASLATLGENPEGQNIRLEQRVAARVYVRVDGPLNPELTITGLEARFTKGARPWEAGEVEVAYTVENTGNVRMGVEPSGTVTGPGGMLARAGDAEPIAELLPGSSQTVTTTVPRVWPLGLLEVTATAAPVAATAAEPPDLSPVSATTRIWAVTWESLTVFALVLVALALAGYRLYRRRRPRLGQPSGRSATPPVVPLSQ